MSRTRRPYNLGGLALCLAWMLFASCEKEEKLWDLPPAGNETVVNLDLGSNYENVIFMNMETGEKWLRRIEMWDLAFASGADEHHIIMNGGKEVQAYCTNETDFAKVYTADNASPWRWDNPNGLKDSTCVGEWMDTLAKVSAKKVYVFDFGKTATPRYMKITFDEVSATRYVLTCAGLDNSGKFTAEVIKDPATNYTYFNITDRKTVSFEPPSGSWDIQFTRYRHVYYDMSPITPYLVNGVLINTRSVSVAERNDVKFEEMNADQAVQLKLSSKADEIGFDWKYYDFDMAKYVVNTKKLYVLKDGSGYYFKLKFIDFYNESGAKGFPKFIYQRL